jgi:hypothetical protein
MITTPQAFDVQVAGPIDGRLTKATIAERDAISYATRYPGLTVFVEETGLNYQLIGGITDGDWFDFASTGILDDSIAQAPGTTVMNDGISWETVVSPILYENMITQVEAYTNPLLEYLSLNAKVGVGIDAATQNAQFTVFSEDGSPTIELLNSVMDTVFSIDDDGNIFGADNSGSPVTLFENGNLKVPVWEYGTSNIQLGTSTSLTGITQVDLNNTLTLLGDNRLNVLELLNLSSVASYSSTAAKQSQLTIAPKIQFTGNNRQNTIINGISVAPSIADKTKIKRFNALFAEYGDLFLTDGIVNIGQVANETYNSKINVRNTSDLLNYFFRAENGAGVEVVSIDKVGKIKSAAVDVSGETVSETLRSTIVSNGYLPGALVADGSIDKWAFLGTMSIDVTSPTLVWSILYSQDAAGGTSGVKGEFVVNISDPYNPVIKTYNLVDAGTYSDTNPPTLVVVAPTPNVAYIYIKSSAVPDQGLSFISKVYGVGEVPTPTLDPIHTESFFPTGTIYAAEILMDNPWTLRPDNWIENNNPEGVKIINHFKLGDATTTTVSGTTISTTHTDTDELITHVTADGKLGLMTNSIPADENIAVGKPIGITSLKRVGANVGQSGNAIMWDQTSGLYLPKKLIGEIILDLENAVLVGSDYTTTVDVNTELHSFLIIDDTKSPVEVFDSYLIELSTPLYSEEYALDVVLRSNTSLKPVYLVPQAGMTIDGASEFLLSPNIMTSIVFSDELQAWYIKGSSNVKGTLRSITANFTVDTSVKSGTILSVSNGSEITFPNPTSLPEGFSAIVFNADGSDVTIVRYGTANTLKLFNKSEAIELFATDTTYIPISTGNKPASEVDLVYAGTTVWDFSLGSSAKIILTGDSILDIDSLQSGDVGLLRVVQDATGSRLLTLPAGSVAFGDISLNPAPNSTTILSFYYDGTSLNWTATTTSGVTFGLGDLVDVTTGGASNGAVLKYNGSVWLPDLLSADEIMFDPDGTSLTSGNVQAAIEELATAIDNIEAGQSVAATNVTYSNTASGLAAVNVQTAIDEVEGDLDTHATNIDVHVSYSEKQAWNEKKFKELYDAPSSYSGKGESVVAVRADELGVEFVDTDILDLGAETHALDLKAVPNDNDEFAVWDSETDLSKKFQWASMKAQCSGAAELINDTTPQLGGWLDTNSKSIHESTGTAITAASTIAPTRTGNTFVVSGSTQINLIDIGVLWSAGNTIRLQFTGTPIITNNAVVSGTSKPITLKKGANYTVVAGDILYLMYDGTVWRELNGLTGGSAGHTIQENSVSSTARTNLNFVTANSEDVVKDDAGNNQTDIELTIKSMNDFAATGLAAGDLIARNSTNTGFEPKATAPFVDILRSSEANLVADGILSTFLLAGYKIDSIVLKNQTANAAGNVSIGTAASGTQVVNAATVGAAAVVDCTLVEDFFSDVNDIDLFISSSAWGTGVVTVYFTFKKII